MESFLKVFWEILKSVLIWLLCKLLLVFAWMLDGIVTVFSFISYVILDAFLTTVHGFFTVLDLSSLAFSTAASWAGLPPQLIWFVDQLALPQCFALVLAAIGVRMLLNLIPGAFTRI